MATLIQSLQDRKIIDLSDSFRTAIGLDTPTSAVFLSAAVHGHIIEQRKVSNQVDPDIDANRIAEALADVHLMRKVQRPSDVWDLIGFVASARKYKHLLVAIKLVPAQNSATKTDELWIMTAHPVGQKTFLRYRSSKEFVEIDLTGKHVG